MDLLVALIAVSEKAANVARLIRQNGHLFDLLVQRKKTSESNPRFVDDFKTLADVLIQEMVKHDIGKQFPELSDHINGEENNVFKNKLGETIYVEIKPSEIETSNLLETVLDGDQIAAALLSAEVHRQIMLGEIGVTVPEDFTVDMNELGIWIDPIDCTGEYVYGNLGECERNIHLNGLKCVTILLGVFNRITGVPVMGIVNRPFILPEETQFSQKCVWGVDLPNLKINSGLDQNSRQHLICISGSEADPIKKRLREHGFNLIEASGAGYKILTVILGLADAYLLSKGTTFKWDTCAPHAILKSLGGDIVDYKTTITTEENGVVEYCTGGSSCNSSGIIAFRNSDILKEIVDILKL
ncbi:unnamed protein product [Phaedon cochleariae]|uniref:Inositol polyphosphate 1-phosphatase n=1 Tax=Phaedon cochleariae TaxID=80249 RepID=A0A9P0DHY1_PHACE|nr:unnamed protein product [Phaedon cochleariae]